MSSSHIIPATQFDTELVPGSVKKVKSANRRSDAMSWMDPHVIQVMDGFNARIRTDDYAAHLRGIVDSMIEDGFHIDKPISVYVAREGDGEVVYAVDGHTRLEAVLTAIKEGAEIDAIPVILLPKSMNMVDMTVGLYRSNTGRPLTPYETALVAKRLEHMGLNEADIARRLALTSSYINGLLILAAAPRVVAGMVIAGEVSASEAIAVLRKHGTDAVDLLQQAKHAAKKVGKTKVTAAHLPGAAFKKAVKKSAPRLLESARHIAADPGYPALNAETRAALDALLEELEKVEAQNIEGYNTGDDPGGDENTETASTSATMA